MFNLTQTKNSKSPRLIAACILGLCLAACEPDNSSILNLEGFNIDGVVAQTVPQNVSDTSPVDSDIDSDIDTTTADTTGAADTSTGTNPNTEADTDIDRPSAPFELSENQIPRELALLTEGEIVTEARFNLSADPIQDRFTLPASGYDLTPDGEVGVLTHVSGSTITICSYISTTAQYLCLRAFDLDVNDRVWHLFTMQSNSNGAGTFEFCTIENSAEDCLNKLIENPDGTVTVTINRAGEIAQLPNASPYYAYENQATLSTRSTDTANVTISDHYIDVMNSLITAAETSRLE